MNSSNDAIAPIVAGPGEGDALWFLGVLATINSSAETTGGAVAVIEHLARELTFWVDGATIVAPAGSFVFGPRGLAHTFIVSSEEARFLLVAQPGGFEQFMRAVGEPAPRLEIPPPATEPPDVAALTKAAAEFGIEIIGPPGTPA